MAYERKLPTTGYWEFVCNTNQWSADEWLALREDKLFYRISNHHRDDVMPGQMGVLRLNKDQRSNARRRGRPKLEAGVYAIFEVTGYPVLRKDTDPRFYSDPSKVRPRWQVQIKVLANLLNSPILASSLPNTPDFKFIKEAIQTSTIALSKEAFEEILSRVRIEKASFTKSSAAERAVGSYFEILWRTGPARGLLDQIPTAWFESEGLQRKRKHTIISREGKPFYAACAISVSHRVADLNYDKNAENDRNEISLGTLRLHFESEARNRISRIEWKDAGSGRFEEAEAFWEQISIDDDGPTTVKRFVNTRLGQAKFRERLKIFWEGRCAVTGVTIQEMLRASHIKPWADCGDNKKERSDPENGLLLIANLDALFDAGKISFSDSGKLLVHLGLHKAKLNELQNFDRLSNRPSASQRKYLQYHRAKFGF